MAKMPTAPFQLPLPVLDWIRAVFSEVNRRSAAKLSRIPTVHETSLDLTVIEQLSQFSAPFQFHSDWVVRLDTHYLGGGRYWGDWEIADLGLLVIFRQQGRILATKIALLQSKRLYPDEQESPSEDHPIDYLVGFGRLLESESEYRSVITPRLFRFSLQSRYRALEYLGKQYEAILKYGSDTGIAVHYLLYNPLDVPCTANLPASADSANDAAPLRVGCRIISADTLNANLGSLQLPKLHNPSLTQVIGGNDGALDKNTWSLEHFVVDLVIGCKQGYLAGTNPIEDPGLFHVFNRRSGPISAAISITIDAPGA